MTDKEIGKFIKERRENLNLTLIQVANKIGVSKSTVSRWESGEIKKIKRSHLCLLSEILYIPIDNLLGVTDKEIEDAKLILKRNEIMDQLNSIKDLSKLEQAKKYIEVFILNKEI